jgi:methionyl-tRNA formyltransferase
VSADAAASAPDNAPASAPDTAPATQPALRRPLVYLGTPDLAVPPLRALVEAGHNVRLVVTRPDRRRGRGAQTSPSPVKREARRLGLPVAHSVDAVLGAVLGAEDAAGASLGVVVAYGRIVPERVLQRLPMVNLHFSLLPRWRGAAPVERAILAGDEVTGVSVMALEPTLDTGPVYAAETVPIEPGEHLEPLRTRLVGVGSRLLVELLAGDMPTPRPQQGEPTYAEKVDPHELELRWDRRAEELARVVRLDRAFTSWRGRRLLVLEAEVVAPPTGAAVPAPVPGTLVGETVIAGDGALHLQRVQPEGRSAMAAGTWVRGARPGEGERLGD